jgi:hypothetical protein
VVAKLPKAESAIIPREKVVNYLLSTSHPVGRSKAAYFRALGFDDTRSEVFEAALLQHAARSEVVQREANEFLEKFVVEGGLDGPTGSASRVRSVWIILNEDEAPRLVTAYPA